MFFKPDVIFSFDDAEGTTPEDWLQLIKQNDIIKSFEIPGSFFELNDFTDFYHEVFKAGKNIVSVKDIIPPSLTRNLATCSENIKTEVISTLRQRLHGASTLNLKYLNLDIGLNGIKSGFEINEISVRTQIIQQVLKTASRFGVTLLHSMRFPKSFPTSQEWKFSTVLINSVMHPAFRSELNIFPTEVSAAQAEGLMKRTYYTAALVRFIYDPCDGARLSSNMHDSWKRSLSTQGYTGDLVFSPKVKGVQMLKDEFEQLQKATETYVAGAV